MSVDSMTRDRWKREVEREFADPRAITGWRTWNETWVEGTRPLSDQLLQAARIEPGMHVLDVASGTGEPALTVATLVGEEGSVIASDPSPELLAMAEEQAARIGLANFTTRHADIAALPFPDASFDRVTCRLGVMYFLDPVAGLAEMRRVLKPGGRAAVLVWGDPTHANYAAAFYGPILSRMTLPTPEPGAPNPYRFAPPGTLRQTMIAAGFGEVDEQIMQIPMPFPGTAADFLRWFREVAIPMDFLWELLGPDESARAVAEIVANMHPLEKNGAVQMVVEVIVASGTR